MAQAPKKVKNYAVEFWRLVFTIGVTFFHFNLFTRLQCMGDYTVFGTAILKGGWVLGYFLFLTGYFMMASYNSKNRRGLIDHEHAYKPAWGYFWTRIKGLWPAFFMGTLFVFITRNIAVGTDISKIPTYLVRAGWEFLGLYQIGVNGMADAVSNDALLEILNAEEQPSGMLAGITTGGTPLWNGPGWYISAIIIVSVIMFYVLCKNKDLFLGFFCPLVIIACYGYTGLMQEDSWDKTATSFMFLPTNLVRVMGGLCLGCLMFYCVDWLKKHNISQRFKVAWNIVAVGMAAFLLITLWTGISWTENQHNLFLLPFTMIVLVGDDVFSKFLSGPMQKVSAYVGKLSLYWYISHWGWVFLLPTMFPDMAYLPMAGVYVLLSFVTANVLMVIDDKVCKPIVAKIEAIAHENTEVAAVK